VLAAPVSRVTLASIDARNFVIPVLAPPPGSDTTDRLTSGALPTDAAFDVGAITIATTRKGEDGSEKTARFAIRHVGSSGNREPGKGPVHGAMTMDELTFDTTAIEAPSLIALREIGYATVDLSAGLAMTYEQVGETLAVPTLMISGVDMGSVNIALDIANVGKGIFSPRPAVAKATALAALLRRVDLTIVNKGLIDKALAWKARRDDKSIASERAELVEFARVQVPATFGDNPVVKDVGAAVATFIEIPKTLHIIATSRDGLGLADMALIHGPDDLLERLDIKAEANK
jgi:PIN domain nuclease of toxin-antitoxin system